MASKTSTIITGDGASLPTTLRINGATFTIQSSAIVKAAIIDNSHSVVLAGPVSVLEATTGSDWANSKIVPVFSENQTASLPVGSALVEIQVDDGGKTTWHTGINIEKGLIS